MRFWVESTRPSYGSTHSHCTMAMPRNHNLLVPSECTTCYTTDVGLGIIKLRNNDKYLTLFQLDILIFCAIDSVILK